MSRVEFIDTNQGCGDRTQISGSDPSSRHLKFLALSPTSKSFWLQNDLVHRKLKTIVLFKCSLAVELEPKFQASALPSESFGLWLQLSNIALAPSPQPWCKQTISCKLNLKRWDTEKYGCLVKNPLTVLHGSSLTKQFAF